VAGKSGSGQLNVRVDEALAKDIATIQRDAHITDRSNAIRFAVRREAHRIKMRRTRR
jgi:hypothetical protein